MKLKEKYSGFCVVTFFIYGVGSAFAQHAMMPMVTSTHVMTHHDNIPRFCNNPTVTASSNGLWSSSSTWSSNSVPSEEARVLIPENKTVTYDVDSNVNIDLYMENVIIII